LPQNLVGIACRGGRRRSEFYGKAGRKQSVPDKISIGVVKSTATAGTRKAVITKQSTDLCNLDIWLGLSAFFQHNEKYEVLTFALISSREQGLGNVQQRFCMVLSTVSYEIIC